MRERDGNRHRKGLPMSLSPSEQPPRPWSPTNRRSRIWARLLRAMLAHRARLLEWYPRVRVPTTLDSWRPTPVAALLLVWERWPLASGPCPRCGGPAVAVSFGGSGAWGVVSGYCTSCGLLVNRTCSGLGAIRAGCRAAAEGTSYPIVIPTDPGFWAVHGPPRELVAVLGELGASDLPHPGAKAFRRK